MARQRRQWETPAEHRRGQPLNIRLTAEEFARLEAVRGDQSRAAFVCEHGVPGAEPRRGDGASYNDGSRQVGIRLSPFELRQLDEWCGGRGKRGEHLRQHGLNPAP